MRNDHAPLDALPTVSDESMRFAVMASVMESGRMIDHASSLVAVATLFATGFGGLPLWVAQLAFMATVVLALAEKYYGWRVSLDARLFAVLAQAPQQAGLFDIALASCLGRKPPAHARTPDSRWQGARRLMQGQAVMLGMQCVVLGCLAVAGIVWNKM